MTVSNNPLYLAESTYPSSSSLSPLRCSLGYRAFFEANQYFINIIRIFTLVDLSPSTYLSFAFKHDVFH